jgi:hypothetical protein
MKRQMTHEEHVELAATLYPAFREVREAYAILCVKLGVTHPATRKIARVRNSFERARMELDKAYHAVTSDAQFQEKAHVYFGGRSDS